MRNPFPQSLPRRSRGFTLIEILVTVAIIVLLATILLAVGSSVHKNSQIAATRTELGALQGMIEQAERENNLTLPTTLYSFDAPTQTVIMDPSSPSLTAPSLTFGDILYRIPSIKSQLDKLAGSKLKTVGGNLWILDSFGNPISFVAQGYARASWSTATKEYLRSSGPDGKTSWATENDPQNVDDILSSDVPH